MKNNNVPEIRFPGFADDWGQSKLGKLYKTYSGMTPLRSNLSNFDNPTTPWIKTTDLRNSSIINNEENISDIAAKKLRLLSKGTVLIAMYGGFNQIGRTGLLTYPATINQALTALEPIKKIEPYFLLTELNYRINYWKKLAASSRKDPNITKRDVEGFNLNYPSIEEQNKISTFFKQLDDTIALHQQELTTLKKTKQGFLQMMFPKEGEKVPEIRFPGFADDWEQRKLGDILDLLKDGSHGTHIDVAEGIYLLSAKNIKNSQIIIDKSTDRKISEDEYNSIHKNFTLQKGDVLLTIVGSIGEAAILGNPNNITFQRSVAYLRPNKDLQAPFLLTTINGPVFQSELKKRQVVSAQPGIYLGDLALISIQIPSLTEQQRIGIFFKQLDDTIALHQRELEILKETKKAFLQKMFV